jgi:hypothetical protein
MRDGNVNHFFFCFRSTPITTNVSRIVVTMTSSATDTYKFTPGLDLRGDPTLDVFS